MLLEGTFSYRCDRDDHNSPFLCHQPFLNIPVVVQLGAFEIAKPLLLGSMMA